MSHGPALSKGGGWHRQGGDLSGPFPSSAGIKATTDVNEAFEGVDVAILVGGFPRKVHCWLEEGGV